MSRTKASWSIPNNSLNINVSSFTYLGFTLIKNKPTPLYTPEKVLSYQYLVSVQKPHPTGLQAPSIF